VICNKKRDSRRKRREIIGQDRKETLMLDRTAKGQYCDAIFITNRVKEWGDILLQHYSNDHDAAVEVRPIWGGKQMVVKNKVGINTVTISLYQKGKIMVQPGQKDGQHLRKFVEDFRVLKAGLNGLKVVQAKEDIVADDKDIDSAAPVIEMEVSEETFCKVPLKKGSESTSPQIRTIDLTQALDKIHTGPNKEYPKDNQMNSPHSVEPTLTAHEQNTAGVALNIFEHSSPSKEDPKDKEPDSSQPMKATLTLTESEQNTTEVASNTAEPHKDNEWESDEEELIEASQMDLQSHISPKPKKKNKSPTRAVANTVRKENKRISEMQTALETANMCIYNLTKQYSDLKAQVATMGKDGHSLVENSIEKLSSDLKDETVRLHNKLKMQKVELSNMISDCQTENSAREKETTLLKTTVYELKQEVAKMAKHNQRQQLPEKEIIENEELSQLKRKINYLELEVATLALCKKTMQVEIDEMTSEIKKVTQNIPEQPEMEPNEQQSMNTPNEGIRAFKGGEDPLSNFYTCTLRRVQNGKLLTFRSSEHSYQYAKAEHHHDETCMALIITSLEPREAKKHGDGITDDVNWTNSREKILEEILLDKMMQSEEFRKELEKSQGMLLAEATRDTFWATGIDGVQATQSSNPQQWAGQNKMGKILKKIQNILPEKAQTPPAYNISTNNRYEILNTQVNTSRKSADLPPNNPKPSNSARGVERRKQTPNASEQDILYIHDSTAKDIDPFKTFGSNSKGLRKRAKTLEVATDFVKEAEGEFKNLVLQVGTNDIANAPQGNISQVLDNVEKLVDAAKRNFAHMQVHLCSILPRRDIRRDTDINTFNSYIRDIANTQERVHYIETFKAFEAQLDRNLEKNRGLHPTKSGVITLGLAMRREFAAACRTGPQQRYAPNRSSAEGGHMREAPQNGGGHLA
jgi:ribA/ribD-fused uncharacterized protein